MTSVDEFIFVLRTIVTKITYRAGIYAFFDWMYGWQRAEILTEYQTLLDMFKAELLQIIKIYSWRTTYLYHNE